MGCSESSVTSIAPSFSLSSVRSYLTNNSNFSTLISSGCLNEEIRFGQQIYETPSQQTQWALAILEHLRKCVQISGKGEICFDQAKQIVSELGQKLQKIRRQVLFDHKSLLRVLEFLNSEMDPVPYGTSFFDLKFNLSKEEVLKVAKISRKICDETLYAFGLLSNYLLKSSRTLNNSGKSSQEINQILQERLDVLRKQFPPGEGVQENQKTINFISSVDNSKVYNKMVPVERKDDLEDYILQQNQSAIKSYPKLVQLTSSICKEQGYNFKTDIKIKGRSNKMAVQRVIEKVFKKPLQKVFKQIQIQAGLTVDQRIKAEQEKYEKMLSQLKQNITEPILFSISDLIRGKCLYISIEAINRTAKKLIQACEQQGFAIIEIDNRLGSKTTDLVFKILIDETIAEFQLALKFNMVQNQFNHKIYEIARSKTRSPVSTLNLINNSVSSSLFGNLKLIYSKLASLTQEEQRKIFHQNLTFTTMKPFYERFLTECGIDPGRETELNKSQLSLMWGKIVESVQMGSKASCFCECQQLIIDGIFLYELGKFDMALQKFSRAEEVATDAKSVKSQILKYKGFTYIKKADFKAALKHLEEYVDLQQSQNKQNILQVAEVHNQIGNIYSNLKKHTAAIQFFDKCIQILQNNKLQNSSLYVQTLTNKGICTGFVLGPDPQFRIYSKALKICLQLPKGSDHPALGNLYVDLAVYYIQNSNLKMGKDYLEIAISIFTKSKGKNCIQNAGAYQNLAAVEQLSNNQNEALKSSLKAVEIFSTIYHESHIECASLYYNIAKVYTNKMDFFEAEEYFNKFIQAYSSTHGENNEMCCNVYQEMGNSQYKRKQFNRASLSFQKCLEIMEKVMPFKKERIAAVCAKGMDASMKVKNYETARKFYGKGIGAAINGGISNIANMLNNLETQLSKVEMREMPMLRPAPHKMEMPTIFHSQNPQMPNVTDGPILRPPPEIALRTENKQQVPVRVQRQDLSIPQIHKPKAEGSNL